MVQHEDKEDCQCPICNISRGFAELAEEGVSLNECLFAAEQILQALFDTPSVPCDPRGIH